MVVACCGGGFGTEVFWEGVARRPPAEAGGYQGHAIGSKMAAFSLSIKAPPDIR